MSEVIKAQAQKVYEARQAKEAIMDNMRRLQVGTIQWGEAADNLRDAVNTLSHEEGLLSSIVIEEELGVLSV